MKTLTIMRHGKANTGATDAASYDQLADMGKEQSALAGAYLRGSGKYSRVICGTLQRHSETVEHAAMAMPLKQDARLNELPYFELGQAVVNRLGLSFPDDDESFTAFFTAILSNWDAWALELGIPSREAVLHDVIDLLHEQSEDTLIVSSGGILELLGSHALGLTPEMTTRFVTPIAHTSIHRFRLHEDRLVLEKYCAIPHLDRDDQRHLVTFA